MENNCLMSRYSECSKKSIEITRGVCKKHYKEVQLLVKKKIRTWDELEAEGFVLTDGHYDRLVLTELSR